MVHTASEDVLFGWRESSAVEQGVESREILGYRGRRMCLTRRSDVHSPCIWSRKGLAINFNVALAATVLKGNQ